MNHNYNDIRSRIPEPPKWWDENAVPRYDTFSPGQVSNIYANEAVLYRIACQSCGEKFLVSAAQGTMEGVMAAHSGHPYYSLADRIRADTLHYGDPPNIGCCPAGPTMNCEDIRVVEYWYREGVSGWQRDASLEITLERLDSDKSGDGLE